MALTLATYSMISNAPANVRDYGAVGDDATDDTAAFDAAIATGRSVYVPRGTYRINATIRNKTVIYGDGSKISIVKPYNPTIAAMTYTFATQNNPAPSEGWTYHSEIRNIGFYSTAAMTGVGFTFAKTNPFEYVTNDEYANNVKFFGCNFNGLEKGLQFPFGNIGTEVYSCGFKLNKYAVYALNNKFGSIMHAGCKMFYGGEMSYNECSVYVDNTADGFGQFYFNSVIFESNNLVAYIKNTRGPEICPVTFTNCWLENNGAQAGYTSATIDQWTGTTRTTQTISSQYPIYLYGYHFLIEGGTANGVYCARPEGQVTIRNCRAESLTGYGGLPFDAVDTAWITFEGCVSQSGVGMNTNPKLRRGRDFRPLILDAASGGGTSRTMYLPEVYSKVLAPARGGLSNTFETAQAFSGATSGTGAVVADGLKYANCNEFTYAFSPPSAIRPFVYSIPGAGYYVFMMDIKGNAANPSDLPFEVSNLGGTVLLRGSIKNDAVWRTVGGLAYVPSATTAGLWFGSSASGSYVWRVSAVMLRLFDTEQQAINFLNEAVYITP